MPKDDVRYEVAGARLAARRVERSIVFEHARIAGIGNEQVASMIDRNPSRIAKRRRADTAGVAREGKEIRLANHGVGRKN